MIKKQLMLYAALIMSSLCMGGDAISSEIILCINNSEEYVTRVNSKSDCLDEETTMTISGPDTEEIENFTPVANFMAHESCEGEGHIVEIGFDKNNDGALSIDEMHGRKTSCAIAADEESEG